MPSTFTRALTTRRATMSDAETAGTECFESPGELARHLYDRAVKPGDTGAMRLRLVALSCAAARKKWREAHTGTDDTE